MTRVAVALVAVLFLAGLVVLGRWEHHRAIERQRAVMSRTFRLATERGLRSRDLSAYRLASQFDCLLYSHRGSGPYALELCFDPHGRLIETIDRRTTNVVIGSVRQEPGAADIRIAPRRLLAAFRQVGMLRDDRLKGVRVPADELPTGFDDEGPRHAP